MPHAWHTPLFWIDSAYSDFAVGLVPVWVISFPALALIIASLYERARSSIFIAALFHATLNMATATQGTEGVIASVVSAAVIVTAVDILRRERTPPEPGLAHGLRGSKAQLRK